MIASGSADKTIKLWNVLSGREMRTLTGHEYSVLSVAFSPDGKTVASGSEDNTVRLWDVANGRELYALVRDLGYVESIAFSPDDKTLAIGSWDKSIRLWDVVGGREPRTLSGHSGPVASVAFSADSKTVVSGSWDKSVKLWDAGTGNELRTLVGHSSVVASVAFSPDDTTVVSGSWDKSGKLWDARRGSELHTLRGHMGLVRAVAFSPEGKTVVSGSEDNTLKLWDVATGRELMTIGRNLGRVESVAFSHDGKILAAGNDHGNVELWDVSDGRELLTLGRDSWDLDAGAAAQGIPASEIRSLAFSPDGKTLVSGSSDQEIKVWDVASGREKYVIAGDSGSVTSVAFSRDGKNLASGSRDKTVKIWRVTDGVRLATLTSFNDGQWAVVDSDGRYDSSGGGSNSNLHWVVGTTPIALDQLKDRYYEPGLLQKVMGYNAEPLRDVPSFEDALAHLFPEIQAEVDGSGPLRIRINLRDQGGGYGKVRVRLNGKEITPDARNGKALSGTTETLTQDIDPSLLSPADNAVDVVAWNAEGYLSSSPTVVRLENARGIADSGEKATKRAPPTLHAIIMGVARFANPAINLTFSGKDASDFAKAITLGGRRLFGATNVKLHLLSDYEDPSPTTNSIPVTVQQPTRKNLQAAFEEVANDAKPGDLLVVFLAGHGVMSDGAEPDYYYLTRDAAGLNLTDPAVRHLWGVSSDELTEWLKKIHASKQLMVLDTCSSGGALQKLTQQRAVPSSQIIALDRLKDRTGFHVLAGAAADQASYETSRFGQGLLTRALLTGMKGAALREGEFVDVTRLFQYARDEVPKLAKEIGGIQAPLVAAPRGESFDIGEMLDDDRRSVPLAHVREMMLRGVFQDEDRMDDQIKLSFRFNQRLRAENQVAMRGRLAYVDADEFPDAWRVAGRYQQTPQGLKVSARLFHNNDPKDILQLTLGGDEAQQIEQLFAAVMEKLVEETGK
jgi:WD40 repeat protein